MQTLETSPGSRTMTIDPATHKLYVGRDQAERQRPRQRSRVVSRARVCVEITVTEISLPRQHGDTHTHHARTRGRSDHERMRAPNRHGPACHDADAGPEEDVAQEVRILRQP